jgi:hypothetical protein
MSYDPHDHRPSTKHVAAAWIICLGIVGLALGLTTGHRDVVPDAVADPMHATATEDLHSLAGVHIPEFAVCRTDEAQSSSAIAPRNRGPMSAPVGQC